MLAFAIERWVRTACANHESRQMLNIGSMLSGRPFVSTVAYGHVTIASATVNTPAASAASRKRRGIIASPGGAGAQHLSISDRQFGEAIATHDQASFGEMVQFV